MFGNNRRVDSAADIELSAQPHESGVEEGLQVVQDLVRDGFVERAAVPESDEIKLQ